MKKIIKSVTASLALVPGAVLAANVPTDVNPIQPVGEYTVAGILANIVNYILGFSAAIAVLFLIYGGIRYIIAGGDEKATGAAKQTIFAAVIGLVVIVLSFVIVTFVKNQVATVIPGQ
ncbi:MAG: pilin [Patescibacteria group bacterium]|nr:pilin [Patescibacteria group bacterium]MCL5093710.1 pilin [Patescibacteria group bacterium]